MWLHIHTSADSAVHFTPYYDVTFQWILEMVLKLVDGTLLLIRYKTKKTCTVLQPVKQNKGNRVGLVLINLQLSKNYQLQRSMPLDFVPKTVFDDKHITFNMYFIMVIINFILMSCEKVINNDATITVNVLGCVVDYGLSWLP